MSPRRMSAGIVLVLTLCAVSMSALAEEAIISPGHTDSRGVIVHEVDSPYQSKQTLIRVLAPTDADTRLLPVVYVLPVEAETESRYGDGLAEIQRHDLANRLGALFVAPTFAQLPWYADHPTDPGIRQESHLLRVVLPFVEKRYAVQAEPSGRLLLGFSKSGWGAWSLLLRHPEIFGRAAAWDAPLQMNTPGRFGSGPIFETDDNFRKYEVSRLLAQQLPNLRDKPARLILLGRGGFEEDLRATHRQLDEQSIPHVYRDGPARKHDWHSGWVAEACELLLADQPR